MLMVLCTEQEFPGELGGDYPRVCHARHWAAYQRPISAETLSKNLRISAAHSRMLVSIVRAERSVDRNPATVAAAGQSPVE